MTGYGSAEVEGYRAEVRSLNHRYLEISVKLPPQLTVFEPAIRDEVKKRFSRGKLDVYISVVGQEKIKLRLNSAFAREAVSALRTLKEELSLKGEIELRDLLIWRELLIVEEVQTEAGPLFEALSQALAEVQEMRLKEGEAALKAILEGMSAIEGMLSEIRVLAPEAAMEAKRKFAERTRAFLLEPADEQRLLQEAAKAAERIDIEEELHRIKGHLEYMGKILSDGGKIGKTLDFILQELYRETNTIASKSESEAIIRASVEMKAQIESIRELVQNIQ